MESRGRFVVGAVRGRFLQIFHEIARMVLLKAVDIVGVRIAIRKFVA
jgi:hypothetical protein